jgi:hypothetical protein
MKFALNQASKSTIEKVTGIKYDDIVNMDIALLNENIEKKIGKKLKFSSGKKNPIGRGSVYLHLNRFFDFNHKKLDKYIDSL